MRRCAPTSLLSLLVCAAAGVGWASDGFWDLPAQLSAEEGMAEDLYAAESFFAPPEREPEPDGAGQITTMCATCFDARKMRSSLDPSSPEHALLSFIGSHEGPGGYDDFFRIANPRPPRPLTTMTVREVRAWQRQAANRANYRRGAPVSSAAGRYQIVSGTMDHLIAQLALSGEELFDAKLQDAMGLYLLAEAGWDEFKGGRMATAHFGDALARVWAALPALSGPKKGRSWYHDFNGNRATVSASEFHGLLAGLPGIAKPATEADGAAAPTRLARSAEPGRKVDAGPR